MFSSQKVIQPQPRWRTQRKPVIQIALHHLQNVLVTRKAHVRFFFVAHQMTRDLWKWSHSFTWTNHPAALQLLALGTSFAIQRFIGEGRWFYFWRNAMKLWSSLVKKTPKPYFGSSLISENLPSPESCHFVAQHWTLLSTGSKAGFRVLCADHVRSVSSPLGADVQWSSSLIGRYPALKRPRVHQVIRAIHQDIFDCRHHSRFSDIHRSTLFKWSEVRVIWARTRGENLLWLLTLLG